MAEKEKRDRNIQDFGFGNDEDGILPLIEQEPKHIQISLQNFQDCRGKSEQIMPAIENTKEADIEADHGGAAARALANADLSVRVDDEDVPNENIASVAANDQADRPTR